MKTMKMIYAVAIAFALVTAGCAHKPVGVTPLAQGPQPPPHEPEPATIQGGTTQGTQLPPDNNVGSTGLPAANPLSFEGMIEDTNALASYTAHFKYDSAAVQKTEKSNLAAVAAAL